jgi:flagellar biosynthesis chaperone FliJ
MAASRALGRLLRIRDLEEEQCHLALESALGELNRLESALKATVERERRGRRLVDASARTGELPDRLAGIEEAHAADRLFAVLGPRIAAKEEEVVARRQEYLAKRIERRQAETLIQESKALEATDADRRGQQALDNWYGSRQHREGAETEPSKLAAKGTSSHTPASFRAPTGQNERIVNKT